MKKDELLKDWRQDDILEWYTEFQTVQRYENIHTGQTSLVFITHCEICRDQIWLSFRKDLDQIISEHRLKDICTCDNFMQELERPELDTTNCPADDQCERDEHSGEILWCDHHYAELFI